MNISDLAKFLSEMYDNAEEGDKTVMVHLFGVRYAEIIKQKGFTPSEIIKHTRLKNGKTIKKNQFLEINKGIKLADYVVEKKNCDK